MTFAEQPTTCLKGVGPKLAERLAQCGLHTVQDVLFHLPLRYVDHTHITPLRLLRNGEHYVIEGEVIDSNMLRGKRPTLVVQLQDDTGTFELRFLHYIHNFQKQLAIGSRLRCNGEVRRWGKSLCMIHPEYKFIQADHAFQGEECLTPIYPSTEGLSQQVLRKLTTQALALLEEHGELQDFIPEAVKKSMRYANLSQALHYLHRPPADAPTEVLLEGKHPMQQRLAFEELLAHHLSLLRLRRKLQKHRCQAFAASTQLITKFTAQLPFALTSAQQRVCAQISADLTRPQPMSRLIQGDVGSGKTVVAALAALQVIEHGAQVALMVPTELLAEQHAKQFTAWFNNLGLQVCILLSRSKKRAQLLQDIADNHYHLIIGTHALFQESVQFANLGLIIIDEQHRFGVHQRLTLRNKGRQDDLHPHQMIMTATPIPRTLAMSVYADLDHSIIDELPPGRKPITTVVLPNERRADVIQRIEHVVAQGQQVYWLCTLIDESENLACQPAEEAASLLAQCLPHLRVGLVHGRLKSDERNALMNSFHAGDIDILVATTVIEVGVDVPNATLMVIENAERLGLAQLHQLRGRVGRGHEHSYCLLLYQTPLSQNATKRLSVMRQSQDGFVIAREDLNIRGPGEVLGTKQSGMLHLRIADLLRDNHLLPKVQAVAKQLTADDGNALIARWIGRAEEYAQA